MNCVEFESELQRGLDRGSLGDEGALQGHLRTCEACRESWDRTRLLIEAISAWRLELPDVTLIEAVVAARESGRLPEVADPSDEELLRPVALTDSLMGRPAKSGLVASLRSRRAWFALATGVAAVVAAAVFLPPGAPQQPLDPDLVQRESKSEPPGIPQFDPQPSINPRGPVDPEFSPLARSAVGVLEDFAWVVTPAPVAADDQRNAGEGELWIDSLQHQLRPIGKSLGDALDFLWEVGERADNSQT